MARRKTRSSSSLPIRDKKFSASRKAFPVVGVGASAGGLEAFKQFLSSLPTDTGMSFVLVQHLDPHHESLSADILSRVTKMSVVEVKDGVRAEPNHVYVIPPNYDMGLEEGVLKLLRRRAEVGSSRRAIDIFFRSLAEDRKDLSIGVVLSGTGSDGTEGLKFIKGEGGITFAQSPQSAKFDDMPKSALASGAVDVMLPPQEIAYELGRIAGSHFKFPENSREPRIMAPPSESEMESLDSLGQIFRLLRNQCHVDFTYYKPNTIHRRLERRMVLHKIKNIDSYAKYLAKDSDEVKALFADILIHVTSFFRDPEAFEALSKEVFSKLIKDRPPGLPIRVWVPACSTGEEVYSIAISLLEFLGDRAATTPVQIFASDISELAIQKARLGEYPESISRDVSPDRLNRFFTKTENGKYKVSKSIRDVCLFSRHDITVDPPFAKLDLISCRNLLIYFTVALQKHVIPVFHYALCPRGFLWVGKSESIAGFSNLFSLLDKPNKIYARKNAPIVLSLQFPASTYVPGKREPLVKAISFSKPGMDAQKLADLALQAEYPGVLINDEMEILHFRGRTGPFIEPAAGVASYSLLKMAKSEFVPDLKAAIQSAREKNSPVSRGGLHFKEGRRKVTFNLKVIPIKPSSASKERYFYVLFENGKEEEEEAKGLRKQSELKKGPVKAGPRSKSGTTSLQVAELQQELSAIQDYQRTLIEKYEGTQEDLITANEELQSANEELQSSNEELETAKEELQSSNEELTTVNDELQSRSVDQVVLSNDLINLLGSVEIPILMLDNAHRIRRFTPLAGRALNLITTDVGRPVGDLKLNFTAPSLNLDLDHLVSEVLETIEPREVEVQDRQGRWFRLQVRPYKTIDNRIDGAVLAFVDIDALKRSLKDVKAAREEAEKANRGKDVFLATLSHELRTPLTSILSWAEMIRKGKLEPEKVKRGIAIIEESGRTQAQLINELLDVSRIVAGKLSLDLHEVNPVPIIAAAIEAVRAHAEVKSVRIVTEFSLSLGTVMADSVRLQQILWNLLTNAVKFSSPGATITVRLERYQKESSDLPQAMIQVVDSGRGIGPEFLPEIFNRFSQEDSSSSRLHGGLGLGLAIVHNLVELHGGRIEATSAGEKQGATFTVFLPLKSSRSLPEKSNHISNERTHEIRLDGVRVLIVDDEPNTREAFTEMLRSVGAETRAAASAREGFMLLQQFKPDVLMSDIAMPREDGYSLIRRVRALSPSEGGITPAIAVTAFAGANDGQQALSEDFQAHLAKPLEAFRLIEMISKLVESAPRRPKNN
jgi:two-component system CheB/CheR fusion protein